MNDIKQEIERTRMMAQHCLEVGCRVTLVLPLRWIRPPGFPRGELLSTSELGNSYSFDPARILAWLDKTYPSARKREK